MTRVKRSDYEAPRVEPVQMLSPSKNSIFSVSDASKASDTALVKEMMAEYGSPLMIVDEDKLRENYRALLKEFDAPEVSTRIGYSFKTNYLPAVCSILKEEGADAEVVSGMEYSLARALGYPGDRIIFNGPHKSREELTRAVSENALINIDGFDEIEAVDAIADELGKEARVGIRLNYNSGPDRWSKFGFNHECGDAAQALKIISRKKTLKLEAVHNHAGTFNVNPKIYRDAANALLSAVRTARDLGMAPTTLDFGGGFPSSNSLKPMFDVPGGSGDVSQQFPEFAAAILNRVKQSLRLFEGRKPTIILEPGRAIVDSAVRLASTVVSSKVIPERGNAVVIDAGVNILPTAYWYDHGVSAAPVSGETAAKGLEPVTLFGPLCMQIDVIRESALLPPLDTGSVILIDNVGAYCLTQSMQFIQPRPAVVLVSGDKFELVRRRETWRDIFALDSVPDRLRDKDADF